MRKKKAEVSDLRFCSCSDDFLRESIALETPHALAPHRLAPHALAKKEHRYDKAHVREVEHLEPPFCFSPLPLTASSSL
jgi:hypothetical protein